VIETYSWVAPATGVADADTALAEISGQTGLHCAERSAPWQGPVRCGPDAVLRPARRVCTVFDDPSPHLDPVRGFYRAERDAANWVQPVDSSVLEVMAVYVVDNGEGDDFPHGPHGNLYWDVFGPYERLMSSEDGSAARRLVGAKVLRGPHRTHGDTDEWLDDEALLYRNAGLFRWGTVAGTEEAIVLRVWESDGSEEGFLGRRNDVLGMEHVRRSDTQEPCGVWTPFHRYSGGHPRRRTTEVALWLQLRTP
jgi:hypothetical protein